MEQRRQRQMIVGFFCLLAVVIILATWYTLRRTVYLTLPETEELTGPAAETPTGGGGALTLIRITPETVQAAVASLSRPPSYRRTVTVTQFFDGSRRSYASTVTVRQPWTRVDLELEESRVRHTLTGDRIAYIWYDGSGVVCQIPAGSITADNEQNIPTYEEVLMLPAEAISQADYRALFGVNCIFLEASEDGGYVSRYWIRVDNGLLAAAERLLEGEMIYRMESLAMEEADLDAFVLPDGTVLAD